MKQYQIDKEELIKGKESRYSEDEYDFIEGFEEGSNHTMQVLSPVLEAVQTELEKIKSWSPVGSDFYKAADKAIQQIKNLEKP